MSTATGFNRRSVKAAGHTFSVQVLTFENGCFVSVAEGAESLGAMVVSLGTEPVPITTTVIPPRTDSVFLRLIAERISKRTKGIAVVSASVQSEIGPAAIKALIDEVEEMVRLA